MQEEGRGRWTPDSQAEKSWRQQAQDIEAGAGYRVAQLTPVPRMATWPTPSVAGFRANRLRAEKPVEPPILPPVSRMRHPGAFSTPERRRERRLSSDSLAVGSVVAGLQREPSLLSTPGLGLDHVEPAHLKLFDPHGRLIRHTTAELAQSAGSRYGVIAAVGETVILLTSPLHPY